MVRMPKNHYKAGDKREYPRFHKCLYFAIDLISNPPKIEGSTALDHFLLRKLNESIPDRFAAYIFRES